MQKKMNFRIPRNKVRTYVGPEFYGCFGSDRPVIHCFKVLASTVGRKGTADARVWFVGMTIPEQMDSDFRIGFVRAIYKAGNRKIRSFGEGYRKVRVFYTRKSAVAAFNTLVEERKVENATARAERDAARAEVANAETLAEATNAVIRNLDHFA